MTRSPAPPPPATATRPSTGTGADFDDAAADPYFVDALTGSGGMADPSPLRDRAEVFPDALVAPVAVQAPEIEPPEVDVPEMAMPTMPTPEEMAATIAGDERRHEQYASPWDRAQAARQAMAARAGGSAADREAASSPQVTTRPGMTSYLDSSHQTAGLHPMRQMPTRTLRVPPSQRRRRGRSGSAWVTLLIFVIFLVISGLGSQLLGAVTDVIGQ